NPVYFILGFDIRKLVNKIYRIEVVLFACSDAESLQLASIIPSAVAFLLWSLQTENDRRFKESERHSFDLDK
ncbi:MAG TPA: hypothetical protein PLH17_01525, partial [Bacilli bacterium]|nr:hypothetical protein [Bacilli bacterium]HOR20495.1 hypothetical protein [Bacilli bacterium]HPK67358.1 hypothetical protein [Bacilli bacterium]